MDIINHQNDTFTVNVSKEELEYMAACFEDHAMVLGMKMNDLPASQALAYEEHAERCWHISVLMDRALGIDIED